MRITISLNISEERAREYLQALRARYNRPRAGWSRLIAIALREIYAIATGEAQ